METVTMETVTMETTSKIILGNYIIYLSSNQVLVYRRSTHS